MKRERAEYVLIVMLALICAGVLLFVSMKYALPMLSPFLIAWGAAFAVRAPAEFLSRKTHISPRVIRPALAVILVLLALGVFVLLGFWVADFISRFLEDITEGGKLRVFLAGFAEPALPILGNQMPKEIAEAVSEGIRALLSSLLERLGGILTSIVSFLPKALFFILITLISLIYFSIDLERINEKTKSFLPGKWIQTISALKSKTFGAIGKYVKSYLQIMLITFFIMLVGFLILRVKDALVVALIVAGLDLLPVLGVGVVMIPWSIFAFATSDTKTGVGLVVIFVVYTVVRELLEPKILGKSLNIHPIVTLISLYLGYGLFGIFGLVTFPILAVLIAPLFKKDKSSEVG